MTPVQTSLATARHDGAFLLLAVLLPGADPTADDPDVIADDLVRIINTEYPYGRVMVAGIPSPQWLTPETLANLRAAARGE